jgi:hypothetical protein
MDLEILKDRNLESDLKLEDRASLVLRCLRRPKDCALEVPETERCRSRRHGRMRDGGIENKVLMSLGGLEEALRWRREKQR